MRQPSIPHFLTAILPETTEGRDARPGNHQLSCLIKAPRNNELKQTVITKTGTLIPVPSLIGLLGIPDRRTSPNIPLMDRATRQLGRKKPICRCASSLGPTGIVRPSCASPLGEFVIHVGWIALPYGQAGRDGGTTRGDQPVSDDHKTDAAQRSRSITMLMTLL